MKKIDLKDYVNRFAMQKRYNTTSYRINQIIAMKGFPKPVFLGQRPQWHKDEVDKFVSKILRVK